MSAYRVSAVLAEYGQDPVDEVFPASPSSTYSMLAGTPPICVAIEDQVAVGCRPGGVFRQCCDLDYLTAPFVFTYPGVTAEEIEPWDEDGAAWRRLAVTFPTGIVNHNPDQTFYYDGGPRLSGADVFGQSIKKAVEAP